MNVYATAPELAVIAGHLRRELGDAGLAALRARLERRTLETDPMDDEARWAARLPCALLDGAGRCTVYAVRPLRCRAFHSTDANACRAAFDGDPDVEPAPNPTVSRLLDAVEAGYDDALTNAGVDARGVRLERGLLALLNRTP